MNRAFPKTPPAFQAGGSTERRNRLKEELQYDIIGNPAVLSEYHACHVSLTQAEVDDIVARAHVKRMWGDDYVPYGVMPEATRCGHFVEIE